ncbi:MAG: hypothetical protein ACKOS8_04485 [Gemmataceae bacterium]
MKARLSRFLPVVVGALLATMTQAQEADRGRLMESLRFHAGFEGNGDAVVAPGDRRIYTVESLARKHWTPGIARADVTIAKGEGVRGDCLRFGKKSLQVICFKGESMPYKARDWAGTVSFWMRLDPDKDLQPGHCDPIQITQKAWDNGALWVDFDKDLPRDFRLGCFSDFAFWNPEKIPYDKWPVEKRPMVTVKKPGFSRQAWKHVAFTFRGVNAEGAAQAILYLDGKAMGSVNQPMRFTWDLKETAILLGIDYIRDLEELMIFDRALDAMEIGLLRK